MAAPAVLKKVQEFVYQKVSYSFDWVTWGNADYLESGTVRKCVCQLRNKLGDDSSNPHIILNERGIGYKFISRNHSNSAKDTLMDANSQEPNTLQIQ